MIVVAKLDSLHPGCQPQKSRRLFAAEFMKAAPTGGVSRLSSQ
jgi:hypothetical protein